MNNVSICTHELYTFEGFKVRRGWLFGSLSDQTPYVTSGYVKANNTIKVWFLKGCEWVTEYISKSNPLYGTLYTKILKGIRKRESKNIMPMNYIKGTRAYEDAQYSEEKFRNNNSIFKKGKSLSSNCYSSTWYAINTAKPKY